MSVKQGFTLIELMVSVSIFAIVAVIATGAVLTANSVNQQAQAIKLTMDNLNFALDSMTLKLKSGGGYYCLTDGGSATTLPYPVDQDSRDCSGGGSAIAFRKADLNADGSQDKYIYRLNNQHLEFSQNGSSFVSLTSDDIDIKGLKFYVVGNEATDQQPRVLISIYGQAKTGHQSSDFAIETTVSDRR